VLETVKTYTTAMLK